jgi:integrase
MALSLVPNSEAAADQQPTTNPQRRKDRKKSPPGVRIRKPRAGQRKVCWSLEWKRDPVTGRGGTLTLPAKVQSREAAWPYAFRKSQQLQEQRVQKRLGALKIDQPSVPMLDEAQSYLDEMVTDGCSPASIRNSEDVLRQLSSWLAKQGCASMAQLTFAALQAWADARRAVLKANGKPRLYTSVNQEYKVVNAMLTRANEKQRAPQWGTDQRRAVLKKIKPSAKDRAAVETIRVLTITEIRAVLAAAVAYDRAQLADRPKYRRLLAPDLAVLLLTGMRRAELSQALLMDVQLGAPSKHDPDNVKVDQIALRDGTTKGGIGRMLPLTCFTVIGVELLREIMRGRGRHEWLSENTYQTLGSKLGKLRKLPGVPADLTLKTLRTTCCTYELHLSGVSAALILKRQGHTEDVANKHYFDDSPLPQQPALELVMQCGAELQAVIDLVRMRNATHVLPRVEKRKKPQPEVRGLQPKTPLQSGPGRKRSAAAG